jgi:DNA-binding transcriptional MerR regulator/quercetin dioxygenase-like cupin family protein
MTIGQVARLLRVSASSLRNWERLGLIKPSRTAGRYRLYSADSVRQLKRIQFLRRVKRINPPGILHMRRHETELLNLPTTQAADVGARLALLRASCGLSLEDAARRTGLSAQFIGRVERGVSNPPIACLQKLTALYGASVLSFFDNQKNSRALVRPRDRGILVEPGVRMELLAFGQLRMEAQLFRVAPRATSGGSYQHEGEEFIYMLSGKFEIWLDEIERYVLEPGDSLYFPSTRTHRWSCVGEEEAVLLWINSPPTF